MQDDDPNVVERIAKVLAARLQKYGTRGGFASMMSGTGQTDGCPVFRLEGPIA
jgi:hypothetical protein